LRFQTMRFQTIGLSQSQDRQRVEALNTALWNTQLHSRVSGSEV